MAELLPLSGLWKALFSRSTSALWQLPFFLCGGWGWGSEGNGKGLATELGLGQGPKANITGALTTCWPDRRYQSFFLFFSGQAGKLRSGVGEGPCLDHIGSQAGLQPEPSYPC